MSTAKEIANLLAGIDRNTGELTAIVGELSKISGSMAEQDTRAQRYIKELLDKSPILMRANAYKVYTFDIHAAVARKLLANVYRDFGYFAAHLLICLNIGNVTAVTNLYLNGSTNDPIPLSDLVATYTDGTVGSAGSVKSGLQAITGFDIREIYYDVTTGGGGQDEILAKLLVGAWVK